MDCKRYAKWMNDAALGALDAVREAELRRHLQGCPRCQRLIEDERRLLAAISQTMTRSLAAEPAGSLYVQTRQRIAEGTTAKVGFSLPLRSLATVAAACVVVVAIVVLAWQIQGLSVRRPSRPAVPTATIARGQPAPQLVHRATKPLAPSRNRAQEAAIRHSMRRVRLHHLGNNPSHQNVMPQVLVPKNEMALVLELYNGVRTGKIDGASLVATPPGFKRMPDGTLVAVPIEIKPIEIAQLSDGSGSGGSHGR